jgi:hypothetical protein
MAARELLGFPNILEKIGNVLGNRLSVYALHFGGDQPGPRLGRLAHRDGITGQSI